ncbi:MAG: ECF transporter S component [Oscillospiraceae bacterium]|nr:ECF transporter S component [Oscillospiraceae bacterium]
MSFVAVCAGIILGLFLLGKLSERLLPNPRSISKARRLTIISICSALAAVLHILDFPLLFLAPEFYKLDFSELPVMLCGFYLGPSAAVACEGLKILLKLLMKGTSTAFVGDFANFAVGCSFVLPAVIVYHTARKKKTAVWGLVLGTVVLAVFGSAFNALYLLPKFAEMFMPMEAIIAAGSAIHKGIDSVWSLVLWCVVPLNLVKGISVSVLTLLLYKRVARPLFGK